MPGNTRNRRPLRCFQANKAWCFGARLVGIGFFLAGMWWPLGAGAQERLDYNKWQLELAEEFDRPLDTLAMSTRWHFAYPWGRTLLNNAESQYYTATEVNTDSAGLLRLTARRAPAAIAYRGKSLRYTSGMLMSRYRNLEQLPAGCPPDEGFSFGLFEVRCRQPRDPHAFPAFWLYGGVPDEIDIFEADAHHLSNNLILNLNNGWRPTRQQGEACACYFYNPPEATGNLAQQYHTYSLSWLPNEVIFYFDGIPIRRATRVLPTGCAMWLILNLAMWEWSTTTQDTLAVDYIRVYRSRQPLRPAGQRPGAETPQSELAWLPAEQPPGRENAGSRQRWRVAPPHTGADSDKPSKLGLELTENLNPPCNLTLPLPAAGQWAPAWQLTVGIPAIEVIITGSDSLNWQLDDGLGRTLDQGAVAAGQSWRPKWSGLAPGAYVLHLRQGTAYRPHPLRVAYRTDN